MSSRCQINLTNLEETEKFLRKTVQSFIATQSHVEFSLQSYRDFLFDDVPKIISNTNIHLESAGVRHQVVFQNVHVTAPTIVQGDFLERNTLEKAILTKSSFNIGVSCDIVHTKTSFRFLQQEHVDRLKSSAVQSSEPFNVLFSCQTLEEKNSSIFLKTEDLVVKLVDVDAQLHDKILQTLPIHKHVFQLRLLSQQQQQQQSMTADEQQTQQQQQQQYVSARLVAIHDKPTKNSPNLLCNNESTFSSRKTIISRNVSLMEMPFMLGSCANHFQHDRRRSFPDDTTNHGAFCVSSNLKQIVTQMDLVENTCVVFSKGSFPTASKKYQDCNFIANVRSVRDDTPWASSSTIVIGWTESDTVFCEIGFLKKINTSCRIPLDTVLVVFLSREFRQYRHAQQQQQNQQQNQSFKSLLTSVTDDPAIRRYLHQLDDVNYVALEEQYAKQMGTTIEALHDAFEKQFLPHCELLHHKLRFFVKCLQKLFAVANDLRKPDDPDSSPSKLCFTPGRLLSTMFRQIFQKFISDRTRIIEQRFVANPSINLNMAFCFGKKIFKQTTKLTSSMSKPFKTNNMSTRPTGQKNYFVQKESLNETSNKFQNALIMSTLSKDHPSPKPRRLHNTWSGFLCCTKTTDTKSTGLQNSLANFATITGRCSKRGIMIVLSSLLQSCGVSLFSTPSRRQQESASYEIFCNGSYVASVPSNRHQEIVQKIRLLRRRRFVSKFVSVRLDEQLRSISVDCSAGRIVKPCFVLSELKRIQHVVDHLSTFRHPRSDLFGLLVDEGVVEYLDCREVHESLVFDRRLGSFVKEIYIASSLLAVEPHHTHAELHSTAILGRVASLIPWLNHNAAPRNSYWSGAQKKAQLSSLRDPSDCRRLATPLSYDMMYTSLPMVTTMYEEIDRDQRDGFSACVMQYAYGFNAEDSLILNKSSVERGLGQYIKRHTIQYMIDNNDGTFCIPDMKTATNLKRGAPEIYRKLEPTGFPKIGAYIEVGDVLIGRTIKKEIYDVDIIAQASAASPAQQASLSSSSSSSASASQGSTIYYHSKCCSIVSEKTGVLKKIETKTHHKSIIITVVLEELKSPIEGDKFCSRHGQKSTVGLIVPQTDLPFDDEGITPDIIINPHAIPSRMTVGQELESCAGLVGCLRGKRVDATPFHGDPFTEVRAMLKKEGLREAGTRFFRDGRTGERIRTALFFGVVSYSTLKHFAGEKCYARGMTGRNDPITGQPTNGRRRKGGGRFGEMERDTLIGHGATHLLRQIMTTSSDGKMVSICQDCHDITSTSGLLERYNNERRCSNQRCRSTRVVSVPFTQTSEQLFQILKAMNISTKFKLRKKNFEKM